MADNFPFYAASKVQDRREADLFEGLEALDEQLAEDEWWALSLFESTHGLDG